MITRAIDVERIVFAHAAEDDVSAAAECQRQLGIFERRIRRRACASSAEKIPRHIMILNLPTRSKSVSYSFLIIHLLYHFSIFMNTGFKNRRGFLCRLQNYHKASCNAGSFSLKFKLPLKILATGAKKNLSEAGEVKFRSCICNREMLT